MRTGNTIVEQHREELTDSTIKMMNYVYLDLKTLQKYDKNKETIE